MTKFENIYKDFLFNKHILVADVTPKSQFEVQVSLAKIYNVKITEGADLLNPEHLEIFKGKLRTNITVPEAFYRGFPESVYSLTPIQRLVDQMYSYVRTYGLGEWDVARHSIFEDEKIQRQAFKEDCDIVEFKVVELKEAETLIKEAVSDFLRSTRPLNDDQYALVKHYISVNGVPCNIASKNTTIKLVADLRDVGLAVGQLYIPDVIKLVDYINYEEYKKPSVRKLNLKNQDRKFITRIIHGLFKKVTYLYFPDCFEKRKEWKGLLHHIHFKPESHEEEVFVTAIRYKTENLSSYSEFERIMNEGRIEAATDFLLTAKGSGAVARNFDYILSRASESKTPIRYSRIFDAVGQANGIILLQLLMHYHFYDHGVKPRTFIFTKHNQLVKHTETNTEHRARRTVLSPSFVEIIKQRICEQLCDHYSHKLGKVYISEEMKKIALPIQENTSSSGYGVLTKGSRLPIPRGKIVRLFTYWERVNDIDLSLIGFNEDGTQTEFSWRTMASRSSRAICYSGDETSGFHGGSEYYDVDLDVVRERYPDMKYLVVCNNIFTYSCSSFKDCDCIAGYMLRDRVGSGEVYEPKTVKSAFQVNAGGRFAYLFAIDLESSELVWLNLSLMDDVTVAGESRFSKLEPYIYVTDVISAYDLFNMLATELVDDIDQADVIVSDTVDPSIDVSEKEVIHSFDFEKMLKYMNL